MCLLNNYFEVFHELTTLSTMHKSALDIWQCHLHFHFVCLCTALLLPDVQKQLSLSKCNLLINSLPLDVSLFFVDLPAWGGGTPPIFRVPEITEAHCWGAMKGLCLWLALLTCLMVKVYGKIFNRCDLAAILRRWGLDGHEGYSLDNCE